MVFLQELKKRRGDLGQAGQPGALALSPVEEVPLHNFFAFSLISPVL